MAQAAERVKLLYGDCGVASRRLRAAWREENEIEENVAKENQSYLSEAKKK